MTDDETTTIKTKDLERLRADNGRLSIEVEAGRQRGHDLEKALRSCRAELERISAALVSKATGDQKR